MKGTTMLRHMILAFLTTIPSCWAGGFPSIDPTVGRPWPLPQSELPNQGSMTVTSTDFWFEATGNDCEILQNAFTRYQNIIFPSLQKAYQNKLSSYLSPFYNSLAGNLAVLQVAVMNPCEGYPHLNMSEWYELKICTPDNPTGATLVSENVWGALRGLETFSQILVPESDESFYVNCTKILDFPRFPHRGLLLDTSRHFLPISKIQETLDLMAMNKFNVFHWHIVDDHSFPYESAVYPDLSAMGAWSNIHVYSEQNVSDIVEYAKDLGIRVIAEFDTPGHTRSWGEGQPGLLTACYSGGLPDGSFGPIDPSKEENFVFLQNLFQEVSDRFPDHFVHLGGDEIPYGCWQSNPDITGFMAAMNISGEYKKLEEYYIARLLDIIGNLPNSNGPMVWQEVFDNGVQISLDTIVQVWKYKDNSPLYYNELATITEAGYQALLSSCWYLSYVSYGPEWHKYYDCDPQGFSGTVLQKNLVLGGEACMWGEYVDAANVIDRTWPNAATVAERLWSNEAATTSADAAAPRLEEHRCRLLKRGYAVEPLGPSFCDGVL